MLLLFDYSGLRERYLSSFRLTFLVRTTTAKGNVERTTTATAPRKYHKVCFYTASATAAIQLDFLCAAAVIICIIYIPKTHHNIINHITSLPVNIIYTCVCEYVRSGTARKRFRFDVVEKAGRKRFFSSRKNRERVTIHDATHESGDVIFDIIYPHRTCTCSSCTVDIFYSYQ